MEVVWDILIDGVLDTLKLLPFLFLAYLLMEWLEQKAGEKSLGWLKKPGAGPLVGGVLGAVPQCGFSAASANLYAGRVITLGTLFAVFLSTSDEMLPLMISHGIGAGRIFGIIGLKAAAGILCGFAIDGVQGLLKRGTEGYRIEELCEREHCHCEDEGTIWKAAIIHTVKVGLFILAFTLALNALLEIVGTEALESFLGDRFLLCHVAAGLIGLIPNCGASVFLTEMYISGVLSFGALMTGLLAGSGTGFLVLCRVNANWKENVGIALLLLAIGLVLGMGIDLVGLVL